MTTRPKFGILVVFALMMLGMAGSPHSNPAVSRNEHMVLSVLWFQTAAEMRALSYQSFNLAKMRIERDIAINKTAKKRAVVIDIDETVLDNSPHMAKLIKESQNFPYAWADWVNAAHADPLPGALEFLEYAVSKGYDVFYVSNRSAKTEKEGTIRNLKAKGFPQAEEAHVLLLTETSSKEPRRNAIEQTHEIVLLMGDNLNDLAKVFEKRSTADRFAEVDRVKSEFGQRFIVFPNPMYGEWENAVYEYQRGLSDEQKDGKRKSALRSF